MQQPAAGLRLGPLGSIIVAEVIFAALEGARASLGLGAGPLAAQLARLSNNYYAADIFSEIPDIESMAQLVQATAEIVDLKEAVPAFL